MNFCPKCGTRLKPSRAGPSTCDRCGHVEGPKRATPADCFPYESMRQFQKEVLEQVDQAMTSKRFIVLEAPVGFGKSAVAAALCTYLSSAYILTSTKQLQDQYASDFGFPVVKGKSNFQCRVPTASGLLPQCSKGRCEADWKLSDCPHYLTFEDYDQHKRRLCTRDSRCEHVKDGKLCPYYEQKWFGFRASVTVCNYPFLMSQLKYAEAVPHRRLLVCDEAHDLEKQIVGFASFALVRSEIARYWNGDDKEFFIPDRGLDDPAAWLDVLSDTKGILGEFCATHLEDGTLQDRVAACKDLGEALERFIGDLEGDSGNWVVNGVRRAKDGSIDEVVFQPIQIGGFTRPLFETADSILFMSATIFSKELLCNTLGVREEDVSYISLAESTFPVENRPIYALNTARLNRASLDASLGSITEAVDAIMDRHVGVRGVIHTTSYYQVNYIMQHVSESNRRRLVTTEGSSERSALLRVHGSTDASVLISPSLFQGVDLKDEMSRFQVVVKVPYPDLSERRTVVKLRRDSAWYDWQTALRLVQTYGRSVRSETDHAVTYVLDSNFMPFVDAHRAFFPAYFLEALKAEEAEKRTHFGS
ncbi:MAG: helicase C-terminal domain-containing protein [Nitrososphaerales archaeon]